MNKAPWPPKASLHQLLTPHQAQVLDHLTRHGIPWYIVGGAVRNFLTHGRFLGDLDLATPLPVDQVMALLQGHPGPFHLVTCDRAYGTLRLVTSRERGHETLELTSFRQDITTDGRHAQVAGVTDIHQDAQRRDFTCNALYMTPQGEVLDPTGQGLKDLWTQRVRFVGQPHERLAEDHLRLLRLLRFHLTLSAAPLPQDYLKLLPLWAPKMALLSPQRRWQELQKCWPLMVQRHFPPWLRGGALMPLWTAWVGTPTLPLPLKLWRKMGDITDPLLVLAWLTMATGQTSLSPAFTKNERKKYQLYTQWCQRLRHHRGQKWLRRLSLHLPWTEAHQIVRMAYGMAYGVDGEPRHRGGPLGHLARAYQHPFTLSPRDIMSRHPQAQGAEIGALWRQAQERWVRGEDYYKEIPISQKISPPP